ncbi:phage tail assembly protein [Methylomonas sp. MS20]|uniref:phage tail assembly protein n=1 Tax=unclassified Methylomonas TaxID=2608980 RepID=UPI0028A2FC85|nr:phage tail assembly protein [Methylomonas sp. MV1]MDT4328544.1 phage tail assembly protein [Methylomonas sp. MV1]
MKLLTPITVGKTQIAELNFRDYTTAEDYLSFDSRGGVAQRIALIASMTGTDEALIKRLRGPDYIRAEQLVSDMLEADAAAATDANADRVKLLSRLTGAAEAEVAKILGVLMGNGDPAPAAEDAAEKKSLESLSPVD